MWFSKYLWDVILGNSRLSHCGISVIFYKMLQCRLAASIAIWIVLSNVKFLLFSISAFIHWKIHPTQWFFHWDIIQLCLYSFNQLQFPSLFFNYSSLIALSFATLSKFIWSSLLSIMWIAQKQSLAHELWHSGTNK